LIGEVWRQVPSKPEFLVSSEGRFMVAPYQGVMPHGGLRPYGGKPHFGVWNKQDGRFITVYKGRTYKIARLICEAFHGAPPKGEPVCMHLDENAANNRPDNLQWGSQKQNLNAPEYLKAKRKIRGDAHPATKTSDAEVAVMRRLSELGIQNTVLVKAFGISDGNVSNIVNNKRRLVES